MQLVRSVPLQPPQTLPRPTGTRGQGASVGHLLRVYSLTERQQDTGLTTTRTHEADDARGKTPVDSSLLPPFHHLINVCRQTTKNSDSQPEP